MHFNIFKRIFRNERKQCFVLGDYVEKQQMKMYDNFV